MKKASTLISVIIAIVMLVAALGVGFSVKQFRVHRAEKAVQAEPNIKQPGEKAALPGGGERSRSADLTDEQRAERGNRFDAGTRGQGGGRRPGGTGMSDEERQAMKDRFENMSEEERAKAREEMRQRFGSGRRGDRGGSGRRPPSGEPVRRDERGGTTEENQDNPPEN